jgi:ubiquinone/menaquinone biosynthesis C-methylase UbiE
MLAQARDRHSTTPGLDFKRAPSDELGVPDGSFDGIRADRVLIHVPSPSATLKEMMRVTKPGGRIVVSEPDMPGCWIASDDHPTTNRIMQAIANSCVTPYLARDLWTMFRDAGLQDVSLTVQPLVAFDPESVGKILDFKGVVASMVAKICCTKKRRRSGFLNSWSGDV